MTDASTRRRYLGLAVMTIMTGLVLQLVRSGLNPTFSDILGDALWAAMMFWLVGALAPSLSSSARGFLSLALCWCVELSQMYHPPWLDRLRATTIGHLALGSDFDPRDLGAYALGIALALTAERLLRSWLRATV